MLCEKNILPKTEIVTYTNDWHPLGEPDWNNPIFGKENPPSEITSYMDQCGGDSGSGNFITNDEEEDRNNIMNFKFVLAAITSETVYDYIDINGVFQKVPCGSNTIDLTIDGLDTVFTGGVSTCITWPKIFKWIKERAQLRMPAQAGD